VESLARDVALTSGATPEVQLDDFLANVPTEESIGSISLLILSDVFFRALSEKTSTAATKTHGAASVKRQKSPWSKLGQEEE